MKRIICNKCKKRRIPWWNKLLGDSVERRFKCKNMDMTIRIYPRHVCKKCLDDVILKIHEVIYGF